ncbi:hypothetical protein GLOIN_2v1808840 [Rhizophagus irregularis DAOM 181602=DAOM 197198]|uniref:MULE transposase domain-containing protein n=4 Tax=Rhizophagus irregularis TaxID=588596 RepID=A0A2P4QN60_RHIID|nr:hypothetical protein GLOIN_2v1808840 [Rhizophagus irregularis DAOM 181602=DAOM 197198]POG79087.1 hypothetical protein GLOIN_2v1808840 [Rhizophagus irregularis DAOM 181602=DAOM 197198]|eukprot:XP_025185953.1 hypothetical protein GLOIN_2v1808840 [Rhizophagus irregularis DAOM 181602=DAOM 197198]
MSIALKELIYSVGQQEYVENFDHGIAFFQTITLEDFSGSAKEIADNIRNLVCESDGYYYIFNCDYQSKKKEPISSFWYKCSQNSDLTKRARKIENLSKQRDKLPITRYDCNGILKIAIDINSKTADIQLYHDLIHDRPERISVNQEIRNFIGDRLHQTPAEIFSQLEINNPNLTQKQCHYWWTILIKKQYQKDLDQLKSSLLLLEESNKEIIMQNIVGNVKYLAFIMPFFNKLIHNQEILIDATYKTNALNFELYAVIGQIDGARFAAAYLFLDNAKKDEGVRTEILTAFLTNLKKLDKDWSQINAAKIVWSNCKIQLCLWHAKKSIKKKLADNSEPKYNAYNPIEANSQFSFIDILWCPIIPPNLPFIFCPKTLQVKILELFTKHFHLHPLIPIGSGEFLSSEDIWKLLTEEMYNFCYENDLKYVWAYMWCNWYKFNLWVLWARAADPEKICIFKTTMLVESHWKHLVKSVNNIITIEFFNIVQRQGIYPLLGMVPEEQNYFNGTLLNKVAGEKRSEGEMEGTNITEGAEDTEDVEGVEEVERMKENMEQKFQEIESYLDQAISIVHEQHASNNYK